MDYLDFYDLAVYANENWKGSFSDREIAENAYIYKIEYDALGTDSDIIRSLLEQLNDDNTDDAIEWISKLQGEV